MEEEADTWPHLKGLMLYPIKKMDVALLIGLDCLNTLPSLTIVTR